MVEYKSATHLATGEGQGIGTRGYAVTPAIDDRKPERDYIPLVTEEELHLLPICAQTHQFMNL